MTSQTLSHLQLLLFCHLCLVRVFRLSFTVLSVQCLIQFHNRICSVPSQTVGSEQLHTIFLYYILVLFQIQVGFLLTLLKKRQFLHFAQILSFFLSFFMNSPLLFRELFLYNDGFLPASYPSPSSVGSEKNVHFHPASWKYT